MRICRKNSLKLFITAVMILVGAFFSCQFSDIYDDNTYKISLLINCAGGAGQGFTFNLIADDYTLNNSGTGEFAWAFENIKTLTITATKSFDDASLQILILKGSKVVQTGFLDANYPSPSSVTNTLTVVWKLDEDKTKSNETTSSNNSSTTSGSSSSSQTQ